MTRVAAIDCGTNSIRLLVADLDPGKHRLVDLDRRMEIVRLGAGVDRTGRLDPAAIERTLAALRTYADRARELGAERTRMVATSASRDAENRADFIAGVREVLGVDPEVITGAEEAALSFAGATGELARGALPEPLLVVDIGGGSTEFVLGTGPEAPDRQVVAARSVDIGCVRLTERHLRHDPPTAQEVAALVADVESALDQVEAEVAIRSAATVVGLAGTVTTVTALALGLDAYRPDVIHQARVSAQLVGDVTARLLRLDRSHRAALPVMHPGRVDVIAAGALVLRMVLQRTRVDAVVASEHDILDGIAWSLA